MSFPRFSWRALAIFGAVLLALDLGTAQIAKRVLPQWFSAMPGSSARASSTIYHHGFRPSVATKQRFGPLLYPIYTNSLAMVDGRARKVDPRAGGCRVLLMGDSFAEGVGNAWLDTFAGRLASAWALRGVEVLNAAAVSYSPTIHYRKLKYLLDEAGLRVDSVLLFLDLSDIADEWEQYELGPDGNVQGRAPDWLMRHDREASAWDRAWFLMQDNSAILHLLRDAAIRAGRGLWGEGQESQRPSPPPPRLAPVPPLGAIEPPPIVLTPEARARRLEGAWEDHRARWTIDQDRYDGFGRFGLAKAAAMMDRLVLLLRERLLPLTIVVYPWPDQIVAGDRDSVQVRFWRAWARTRGTGFIDLFPLFLDGGTPAEVIGRYVIPRDFHWNAAGHAMVAAAIDRQFDPRRSCP
ncbi:MAG: hypothetical protein IT562_18730 [Alphaproteobacteria bacterium]|nr:hypothetical protein [Alphaproteobacteria bacterium]